MYQEFEGHSGPIKKLIFTQKNLVTLSTNNDGFFIWKSKGSHTQRVREETYNSLIKIENNIKELDYDNKDINNVVNKSIELKNTFVRDNTD